MVKVSKSVNSSKPAFYTRECGQLFAMEGLIAAAIMITAAYLALGTVILPANADMHVSEMQLKQIGDDLLHMMDVPDGNGGTGYLESVVYNASPNRGPVANSQAGAAFNATFINYLRKSTGATINADTLRYSAAIYCVDDSGEVVRLPFANYGDNTGRNPSVCCARYVAANDWGLIGQSSSDTAVRLEVLLWRD
ncbi:DUF7288 family protein [Methanomicrobium mobile]|uniref:DUF7288 family protein n=1 Tax=Methanomicrobium mobile TaxID=2205 RepID=UPI0005B2771F|nr:hypothetical protein [Methanomicrobium mobile]